jgi:hypothetical protein
MSRRVPLAFLVILLCCRHRASGADLTLDRITALAKIYFRDSAEVPMSVAVTTVVTDAAGKERHRGQSTVSMVFHGYNQQSGKFSLHANSGFFNTGALRDSLSGDLAAFFAGLYLVPKKDSTRSIEIRQPAEAGKPVLVVVKDGECPALELLARWLFPPHPCGTAQFSLTAEGNGDPMFQRFSFESSGRPAAAKIAYLGDVQLQSFHAAVDFQKGFLPGDPKPFLWPLQAVTAAITSKGTVTITNRYSPKK